MPDEAFLPRPTWKPCPAGGFALPVVESQPTDFRSSVMPWLVLDCLWPCLVWPVVLSPWLAYPFPCTPPLDFTK